MIVMPPPSSNHHLLATVTLVGRKASPDARFDRFLRLFPLRVGLSFVAFGGVFALMGVLLPFGFHTPGLFIGASLGWLIGVFWLLVFFFGARK